MSLLRTEYIPLSSLKRWPRNPRKHFKSGISSSIDRFGFLVQIIIDERTSRIVAGHGRLDALLARKASGGEPPAFIELRKSDGEWLVPVTRGASFSDDKEVEAFLISDNAVQMAGSWDDGLLQRMASEVSPIGVSIREASKAVSEAVATLPQTAAVTSPLMPVTSAAPVGQTQSTRPAQESDQEFDNVSSDLQGVIELKEDCIFDSLNSWGIPDLRTDMLVGELPEPLDTWGDRQATPDDGRTYWLYNYGAVPSAGLPFQRAIFSGYTWDSSLEVLWRNPSYMTAKLLNAGIKMAIVPDFSLWEGYPRAVLLYAIYRAQWMGRYFQEAGLKVIPRVEYFMDGARDFSLLGIPVDSPVISTQMHTGFSDENVPALQRDLRRIVEILQPTTYLFYASERGRKLIEEADLPCKTVILPTASSKRKQFKREKETDPKLLELRKRKRKGMVVDDGSY